MKILFTVNGTPCHVEVPGASRLLDVLRETIGFTGTKEGCGEGECGACSVILDGEVVNSCLIPAGQVNGSSLITVEGLAEVGGAPLQEAFVEFGAAQCGICTPGMLLAAHAFCAQRSDVSTPMPTRAEIRESIAGNLCRCTGYQKIVDAIEATLARARSAEEPLQAVGS